MDKQGRNLLCTGFSTLASRTIDYLINAEQKDGGAGTVLGAREAVELVVENVGCGAELPQILEPCNPSQLCSSVVAPWAGYLSSLNFTVFSHQSGMTTSLRRVLGRIRWRRSPQHGARYVAIS